MEPLTPKKESTPAAAASRLLSIYLLIGFAWILLSDYAVNFLVPADLMGYGFLDTIKGLAFVTITGLIMFKWLLQRELIRREQTMEELQFVKQLNELSNDPVYVLDPADDFRMVYVNEAAVRHFGVSREKLLTLSIRDWDPAYAKERAQVNWQKLKAAHFAVFESEHHLADGRVVPVEISANYIQHRGKEYAGGYFRDISERKKVEAELRESRERYHLALRGAELGTWDWNIQTGHVIFNRRLTEMLGYRLEELEPNVKTWENLIHPEDLPGVMKVLQLHLEGRSEIYKAEHRLKTKSGEWLWVLDSGCVFERNAEGKPLRAVGTHQNIDAQKKAEQHLREQRAMLEGILNSVPQAVFWKDRDSRYLGCNRVFAQAAGFKDTEQIVGKTDFELPWGPREAKGYVADDQQVIASKKAKYNIIEPTTIADGSQRWLETSKTPLLRPDGEVFGVLGVFEDITERKRMEQQLRQERDFSQWTMDALPGVFYVLEKDGRVRMWNPQLERVTGRTSEQINGLNCLELLHPEDHALTLKAIEGVFLKGEDQVDARLVALDGSSHPHHFRGRRIELEGRQCILGIGIDISERMEIEAQLGNQLRFQQTLMSTIPVPIFTKDLAGRYLEWNLACEKFMAMKREDSRGKTVTDLAPPELAKVHVQKDQELLSQGGIQAYECKVRSATGELRTAIFHKAILTGQDGQPQGIIGAVLDITELKKVQEHLLLEESALNAAANGIVITDATGKILWANPAFTTLTGYATEEVTGLTPQVLKSGRQDSDFYQQMWRTISSGQVWRGELVNRRKDGTLYDEEMTITPVLDAAGRITNFIAIKQDISQRKQMEAQYLRAQRMEGIGMLAGGIAHDLNNVLAPILMSIELLKDIHPDAETSDILHSLQDSAQRGADIVRQVLTFARGIKGERLLLAPKHLIKDMGRVAQEAFPRNIRVTTNVPADLWNVSGDPTQLHQVLLNLCINARDAMPDGGTLRIDARNETVSGMPSELGIQMADGDYVVLVVKDTGMGIPPELHERIFEPFFTTKELGKGTGLGLSTVMGIVKSHHGYLRINSEPGKGAEFLVYLPAVKDVLPAAEAMEKAALPQGEGELVMVVDDEPAITEVAKDILIRNGYRVLTASDGTEAMALVAQNQSKVHLVVTDIMMPFMDGVALVRGLRKLAPEVKVIACSGLASGASMTSKVEELRRLGVSSIMHKPFTARKLLVNVNHVLHNEPLEPEESRGNSY
ncbi:MAG: PAS domain S-box protein [Verrucomicrobiota bacterium]